MEYCSRAGERLFVHDFIFLGGSEGIDLSLELLGQFLGALLAGFAVIFAKDLILLGLVGVFIGVAADIADRDPGFLGKFFDAGDQLLAAFGGEGGDVESDESSVGIRGQADVAGLDGLGDRAQGRGVEGPDNDLLGFGTTDAGDLLERSWGAVVIDPDRIDQPRSSASGADPLQLFLEDFNGLFHAVFRIQQNFILVHGGESPWSALNGVFAIELF